jgi:hypothetical protein
VPCFCSAVSCKDRYKFEGVDLHILFRSKTNPSSLTDKVRTLSGVYRSNGDARQVVFDSHHLVTIYTPRQLREHLPHLLPRRECGTQRSFVNLFHQDIRTPNIILCILQTQKPWALEQKSFLGTYVAAWLRIMYPATAGDRVEKLFCFIRAIQVIPSSNCSER